jgi:hypothetical protein
MNREYRAIENAAPFRRGGLEKAQIVWSKDHDPRPIQRIGIAANRLSVEGGGLLSDREFHSHQSLESPQVKASLYFRAFPSPKNKVGHATCPKRSETNDVIGSFENIRLALSVLAKEYRYPRTELDAHVLEVSPAPKP